MHEVVLARLDPQWRIYTPEVQAERRRYVRRQAAVAISLLHDAAESDDADDLAGAVWAAARELGHAEIEILRMHMG